MNPDDLRAFAARDWKALAGAKRAHVAQVFKREGPLPLLRAARALFEHARAVNPGWPSVRDRAADLAHHVELKRLLMWACGAGGR